MRVTGGILCGRKIECPEGVIRPAMDRMRESVFAILGGLTGKSFLDAFAGSGSISLEAASRGAAKIVLVESDRGKIPAILKNIAISPVKIECKFVPAERFLRRNKQKFDFVFFDPPFPYKFHRELLEEAARQEILAEGGAILIHRPRELQTLGEKIGGLSLFDRREYGRSIVDFYRQEGFADEN